MTPTAMPHQATSYEQITTEERDGVLIVTLNRPDRLNAWTPLMSAELVRALDVANDTESIGAIVITGAGRGFCAGADIEAVFGAQLEGDSTAAVPQERRDWVEVMRTSKPIVAAINGVAVGLGLTLILPADRIIASTDARFSVRFVRLGLVPELASSHFLPARVGFGVASDMMLSGRMVSAEDARATGLIDELVSPESLLATAIERAKEYGGNPSSSLRWIKELLTSNACETDLGLVQRRELERLQAAYKSPEHAAAVEEFLDSRRN